MMMMMMKLQHASPTHNDDHMNGEHVCADMRKPLPRDVEKKSIKPLANPKVKPEELTWD